MGAQRCLPRQCSAHHPPGVCCGTAVTFPCCWPMTFLRVLLALAPSDVCNPHTSQFALPICKCLPAYQTFQTHMALYVCGMFSSPCSGAHVERGYTFTQSSAITNN